MSLIDFISFFFITNIHFIVNNEIVKHTPVLISHAVFMGVFTHKFYKHFIEGGK